MILLYPDPDPDPDPDQLHRSSFYCTLTCTRKKNASSFDVTKTRELKDNMIRFAETPNKCTNLRKTRMH
jgi:hypothetical protein